ncbi:hypothetical protein NliqN6_5196 [Naganishia liquefaciens]|uniref:Uncharacterized protein n=1 Tax=Naganishia liquefaciens TaxID=104408 RepID=A0A8H3YGI7_9TREE|nr:hypothetical protein NliqN6_5196 [Naganishia liquefaciens]
MLNNNASSSNSRNPLEELPLESFTRPPSASSSASTTRTTPSSTSSFLSSGSRVSTGSSTGSTRIVHLPLSSPAQDGSSSRTVRPVAQQASPSARRWPSSTHRHARGSSLSVLQSLTPGRLHSGVLPSSPLNPRALGNATPSAEERRRARRMMMEEGDNERMMDVEEEPEENLTARRRSIGSLRDRDREIMPPPEVPISALTDRSPLPSTSPARRLFVAPNADTPSITATTTMIAPLQPSPPLPPNAAASASPFIDAEPSESSGKTKPRARTSTGRESPCPTAVKEAIVKGLPSESGGEVAKKVRVEEQDRKGKEKQRMDIEDHDASSSTTTEEEERLSRQRTENADPHDCGFSVWEDMNGAGPSSLASTSSTSQLSAASFASNSARGSPVSMSEKNKKAMAWLTIPFDNQENIKPPSMENGMTPFILESKKAKLGGPSGSGSPSTSGPSRASSTAKAASTSASASPVVDVSVPRSPLPVRTSSATNIRSEISIRTSMRGSIAPTDTTVGGLRGPECLSPVKTSISQPVERTLPVLKLRRGTSSVPAGRGNVTANTNTVPARPVLILRRTGSAENVNTNNNKSVGSRTSTESTAQEQENEVFPASVIAPLKADDNVEKRNAKAGRKKRKSDEMNDSSDAQNDTVKKRPPTRSTAGTIQSSSPDVPTRGAGARTRRSRGNSIGEKKTGPGTNGKKGAENGYKGRVLRSMTRAGNGL